MRLRVRHCPLLISLLATLALSAGAVGAQVPYPVIDLDTSPPQEQGSNPRQMLQIGDLTFFIATTPGTGEEVWVSDGTPAGSRLLTDIRAGELGSQPRILGRFGDLMFFAGRGSDGSGGASTWQLWRSDGSAAGTFLLRDLESSAIFNTRSHAIGDQGLFLFLPGDANGDLWISDGSAAGTRRLSSAFPSGDAKVVSRGVDTAILDRQGDFWLTDGTVSGTRKALDLEPLLSVDNSLSVLGPRYLFAGTDTSGVAQVWSHNCVSGTMLASLDRFTDSNTPMVARQDRAYFQIQSSLPNISEIWRTDGTSGATEHVVTVGLGQPLSSFDLDDLVEIDNLIISQGKASGDNTSRLVAVNVFNGQTTLLTPSATTSGPLFEVDGQVLFEGNDPQDLSRLWVSDGTVPGTRPIFDPCLEGEDCFPSLFAMTPGLEGIVFAAGTADLGIDLWTSDGSVTGTRAITNFNDPDPFPAHFTPQPWLTATDSMVVFAAADQGLGEELWASHGSVGSTSLMANLALDAPASSMRHLATFSDQVLFTACDGQQTGLWSSDGTADSALLLASLADTQCATDTGPLVMAEGRIYFTVGIKELWTSDGTVAGTRRVYRLPGSCSFGETMVTLGERLLFVVFAPGTDQVWLSDGTPDGTGPFSPFDAYPVQGGNTGYRMVSLPGRAHVFIEALGDSGEHANWLSTDGTVAGTELLQRVDSYPHNEPLQAARLGDTDYVALGTTLTTLWRTDGTAAGTVEALGFQGFSSRPRDVTAFGDRLFFVARLSTTEDALWSSDADGQNVVALASFPRDEGLFGDFASLEMLPQGENLYFVVDDGVHGRELWRTDGSVGGTELVRDIFPGTLSSLPRHLTAFGDHLYFSANGGSGDELWRSDGTALGTVQVADISIGPLSSAPQQLKPTSNRLFFTAVTPEAGRELWAQDIVVGGTLCQASATTLCLASDRIRVTMQWTDFAAQQGAGQAVSLGDETGAFWFFNDANLEAMVKVIDGRDANGHFWVFYGALSNVAFDLTVDDMVTGESVTYTNPLGTFASAGDITALPAPGNSTAQALALPALGEAKIGGDPFLLSLGHDGRFEARVEWTDFQGNQGLGTAVHLTADSGTFWFFGSDNMELMVKVIDGRDFNGKYWVFYGALSNVAFRLTVEDTLTGNVKVYDNAIGTFASRGDIDALPGDG